eukprot:259991-Amorphochlora_amoeboformis.AAC.1
MRYFENAAYTLELEVYIDSNASRTLWNRPHLPFPRKKIYDSFYLRELSMKSNVFSSHYILIYLIWALRPESGVTLLRGLRGEDVLARRNMRAPSPRRLFQWTADVRRNII